MEFFDANFLFLFTLLVLTLKSARPQLRGALVLGFSALFYLSHSLYHAFYLFFTILFAYSLYVYSWKRRRIAASSFLVFLAYLGLIIRAKYFPSWGMLTFFEDGPGNLNDDFYNILLPIGVSFHLLQNLSLFFDLQRTNYQDPLSLKEFLLMNFFFPKVLAGPIDRVQQARQDLSFNNTENRDKTYQGIKLFIFGAAYKTLIANKVAPFVDTVFGDSSFYSGQSVLAGLFFFRVQLFADFYGYFLMAYGLANIVGANISINFRRPYCSIGFSDHWRRWNITLGGWFRDYAMFPLAHKINSRWKSFLLVTFIFALVGVWHGFEFKFLVWGIINGVFVAVESNFLKKTIFNLGRSGFFARFFASMATLALISLASVFIRAKDTVSALDALNSVFSWKLGGILEMDAVLWPILLYALFEAFHWLKEMKGESLQVKRHLEIPVLLVLVVLTVVYQEGGYRGFIYFQF